MLHTATVYECNNCMVGVLTLSQDKKTDGHVDKDPRKTQELNQVIHEKVTLFQAQVG